MSRTIFLTFVDEFAAQTKAGVTEETENLEKSILCMILSLSPSIWKKNNAPLDS